MGHEYRNVGLRTEHDRHEYDDGGQGAGDYRNANFLYAFQGCPKRIVRVQFTMAEYALGHHHCVVDEHANCEHQAHHRQHVQTEIEKVQRAERNQQ